MLLLVKLYPFSLSGRSGVVARVAARVEMTVLPRPET